jgi:hypothetical protein
MDRPQVRILDLDGAFDGRQSSLADRLGARWISARSWGRRVRLACTLGEFDRFRRWLRDAWPDDGPAATLYGSGDFHHVTLALLERIRGPFNLLVLDKHPDWMRGVPFLHCGTWLARALRLSNLRRVFHCGGETDFDNAYRRLAPWPDLRSGRVVVFPARRRFARGGWSGVETRPLLAEGRCPGAVAREALRPFAAELARYPLYVSFDKDVLADADAAVNWDSGLLRLPESAAILAAFLDAAVGRLAGADLLGDWSPVHLGSPLAHVFHRLDHPSPQLDPSEADARNLRANSALLSALLGRVGASVTFGSLAG